MAADPASAWWVDDQVGSLEIASLRARFAAGTLTAEQVIDAVYDRIDAYDDPATFIGHLSRNDALAQARRLGDFDPGLPLWGIPCAVKDNIDAEGFDTTLACFEAAFEPDADAPAVAALRAAGAIVIGKTNLDQFATGLNGTRSPYGVPRSPWRDDLIPGGSSSGSGVAVAAGLVSFALGTDTAGSGRLPAALGGIVGLKPSRGLVSTRGVFPACASLDCVSVFALTVADAAAVASVVAGYDERDPYSRQLPVAPRAPSAVTLAGVRIAVPADAADRFGGEFDFAPAWAATLHWLEAAGVTLVEVDLSDFYAAGDMLYGGAWLAERHAALLPMLEREPQAVEPTVRAIVSRGAFVTAGEVFSSLRDLTGLQRAAGRIFADFDALLTPTTALAFTIEHMRADPIAANQRLGRFTTFTNLLDLAAVAIPASVVDGVPFGVSLQGIAGSDARLAELAAALEARMDLSLGAPRWTRAPRPDHAVASADDVVPERRRRGDVPSPRSDGKVLVAVIGAHLRGQPLHGELVACGAEFVRTDLTAANYRLFALPTSPPKPGLVRTSAPGIPQEVEVYEMGYEGLGRLLASAPQPLGLATVTLEAGQACIGFLCEAIGVEGAPDISAYGGWRAYLASATRA